jgi:hypothetical protein
MKKLFLLSLLSSGGLFAQLINPILIYNTDPSGTCIPKRIVFSKSSGTSFYCNPNTNLWAQSSSASVSAGTGIVASIASGTATISVDTSVVPSYLATIQTLAFTAIAAQTCQVQTFTWTGTATGTPIAPGWPATLEAGLVGIMYISAANTGAVRLCNITSGSITPASQTYKASILQSF